MVAAAKPRAAECWARATSRGYILCSPPGWPSRISGAGAEADPGVQRMPGISPRVISRSRTSSSRRCSEVNRMVVPFGSALERRSRTPYRPTMAPEGSTHVNTAFTGTNSSFSCTAAGRPAAVAEVCARIFAKVPTAARTAAPRALHSRRNECHGGPRGPGAARSNSCRLRGVGGGTVPANPVPRGRTPAEIFTQAWRNSGSRSGSSLEGGL